MRTKNLCAAIPEELHQRVSQRREQSGLTTAQYITQILTEYYNQKENGGNDMNKGRTMAFQISEELFQKIKAHLEAETNRTGKKLTQREFVIGLIEQALVGVSEMDTEEPAEPTDEDGEEESPTE